MNEKLYNPESSKTDVTVYGKCFKYYSVGSMEITRKHMQHVILFLKLITDMNNCFYTFKYACEGDYRRDSGAYKECHFS